MREIKWALDREMTKKYRKAVLKFSDVMLRSKKEGGSLKIIGFRVYRNIGDYARPIDQYKYVLDIKFIGRINVGYTDKTIKSDFHSTAAANTYIRDYVGSDLSMHLSYFGINAVGFISVFRSFIEIKKIVW